MIVKTIPYSTDNATSGIVGRLLGKSMPKKLETLTNDTCYCDYECEFIETVFADASSTTWWKNDKNDFLFQKFVTDDIILLELWKNGSKVAEITDNTYGNFINNFANAPLYVYFCIDWKKVLTDFGFGYFKIKAQTTILGQNETIESRRFRLLPYSDINANGTVRIETYQTGNILNSSFDYSLMLPELPQGFYSSYRIPAKFGNKTPKLEVNNYLNANYRNKQITSKITKEYTLFSNFLPAVISNRIQDNEIHANRILLTDYTLLNVEIYRRIEVVPTDIETKHFENTLKVSHTIKFKEVEETNLKINN